MAARLYTVFRRTVAPALADAGFSGAKGHWIRRVGPVTQVVELQQSVFGSRVTANLGLDLEWLPPPIRWIPRPEVGPHAHDATRWIRIGLTQPERVDRWWTFGEDEASVAEALEPLRAALLAGGFDWLARESTATSFLRDAEDRARRAAHPERPYGGFPEVRLLAAVQAWAGETAASRDSLERAATLWPDERGRLESARLVYLRRHPSDVELPGVPDLLAELEALLSPPAGSAPPWAVPAPRRARR
jgi:hypothetical protein